MCLQRTDFAGGARPIKNRSGRKVCSGYGELHTRLTVIGNLWVHLVWESNNADTR
jgi:hypothetical protein